MRILRLREVKGEVQDHIASNRVEFEPKLAGTRAQICDLYSTLPLRDPKPSRVLQSWAQACTEKDSLPG